MRRRRDSARKARERALSDLLDYGEDLQWRLREFVKRQCPATDDDGELRASERRLRNVEAELRRVEEYMDDLDVEASEEE